MKDIKAGDFAVVIGGKAMAFGTFVEVALGFGDGVFLCRGAEGNFIVTEKNLKKVAE